MPSQGRRDGLNIRLVSSFIDLLLHPRLHHRGNQRRALLFLNNPVRVERTRVNGRSVYASNRVKDDACSAHRTHDVLLDLREPYLSSPEILLDESQFYLMTYRR